MRELDVLVSALLHEGLDGNGLSTDVGSASAKLLRQTPESLAGRVAHLELTPLRADELALDHAGLQRLWLQGGFPLSYTYHPTVRLNLLVWP